MFRFYSVFAHYDLFLVLDMTCLTPHHRQPNNCYQYCVQLQLERLKIIIFIVRQRECAPTTFPIKLFPFRVHVAIAFCYFYKEFPMSNSIKETDKLSVTVDVAPVLHNPMNWMGGGGVGC